MNLALKKRKALHQHFLSLLCDNHSSKTKEMLNFRCSYLPVSVLPTYAGVKTRDAKGVSPCISSQLCICAGHDNYSEFSGRILWKRLWEATYMLGLESEGFKISWWVGYEFLPVTAAPLSASALPTVSPAMPCQASLAGAQNSSAPGWDAAAVVTLSLCPCKQRVVTFTDSDTVLWNLNSWRSIQGE